MIGIVDYGAGNLASVGYALDHLGLAWTTVRRPGELAGSDAAIFPGVGAAGAAMSRLRQSGLERALVAFIESGRPYLGICLGLQLLFQESAEDGSPCLDVLGGRVVRLPTTEKLPHVGWNTIELLRPCSLLDGMDKAAFYFTHSYVVDPATPELACARTSHGSPFVSALERGQIFGVQFHPERSGDAGLQILSNFAQQAAG